MLISNSLYENSKIQLFMRCVHNDVYLLYRATSTINTVHELKVYLFYFIEIGDLLDESFVKIKQKNTKIKFKKFSNLL